MLYWGYLDMNKITDTYGRRIMTETAIKSVLILVVIK